MTRKTAIQLGVFCLLLVLGVLGRWYRVDENITPTIAIALFSGFFFEYAAIAVLLPCLIMVISNFSLPAYLSPSQMFIVYAAVLFPVALRWLLRGKLRPLNVVGCTLLSSVSFFLFTNFAFWWCYHEYPHTWHGLVQSYVAGLEFFRWMPVGDLIFSGVLFGTYALAARYAHAMQPALPSA